MIVIHIDRKVLIVAAAVALIATAALRLWSESLTLVTTYPAPSGIYNQIVTTGNSGSSPADTTLNRNAGNTIIVPATNGNGRVGIGTTNPAARLHVYYASGDTRLRLQNAEPGGGSWDLISNGGANQYLITDTANIKFRINAGASGSMILNESGGSVGIGTGNPSSKLHVEGRVTADNVHPYPKVRALHGSILWSGFYTGYNDCETVCSDAGMVCYGAYRIAQPARFDGALGNPYGEQVSIFRVQCSYFDYYEIKACLCR